MPSQRRTGDRLRGCLTALAALTGVLAGVSPAQAAVSATPISVVAAENEYGNVAAQIGGPYVHVLAVETNPNTDPHAFEASPGLASAIAGAQVVVQNGLGYDAWIDKLEGASPDARRKVIDVQTLLHLPNTTPNPHLWYSPQAMPAVARTLAADLAALDPGHATYFQNQARAFDTSLAPWLAAVRALRVAEGGAPVATTEPVADYMLEAAGLRNLTPFPLQADIMNGVDPSPQAVSIQESLISARKVKVLVYNEQVTDQFTNSLLPLAHQAHVPVVGVYETMPVPGYTYQTWMLAEVRALENAILHGRSAPRL